MYRQIDAPVSLQKLVCFFYCMEHSAEEGPLQNLLPSNTEIMGWQYAGKWRVQFHDRAKTKSFVLPDFYTTGQQTLGYNLTVENERAGILGASLQPGSLWQIFRRPIWNYTNRVLRTEDVFRNLNAAFFLKEYAVAKTELHRLEVMTAFYTQIMAHLQLRGNVVFDAVSLIFERKGALSVSDILEKLHLNEKYLQRNFKKIIGTTPIEFIRNVRFANVFTQISLSEGKQNKELLAMLYNYYDLSHFQKDYKYYFKDLPSSQLIGRLLLFRELIEKDPYLLQSQLKF